MKKILLFVLLLAAAYNVEATIRRVNNNPNVNSGINTATFYTTLSIAYSFSVAGDTIILEPSPNSYGSLTLTKRLVIFGNGYFGSNGQMINNNYSALDNVNCNAGSGGSFFSGIWFNSNLSVDANDITIRRCRTAYLQIAQTVATATNCKVYQSFVEANGIITASTNCLFQNVRTTHFFAQTSSSSVVENCDFSNIVNLNSSQNVFRNCIFRFAPTNIINTSMANNVCIGCTITCPNCTSNAAMLDVFKTNGQSTESDFILQTTIPNPALNTGFYGNGDDIGLLTDGVGRPTYKVGGVTATPSISSFQFTSQSGNSTNAVISTKGNN